MRRGITVLQGVLLGLAAAAWLAPSAALAAGDAARGKEIYMTRGTCFTCHGPTGAGDGMAAAGLQVKPRNFQEGNFKYDANGDGTPGEDADLALIIKNSPMKYGGAPGMPQFPQLSDQDIQDLIAYIRTLHN